MTNRDIPAARLRWLRRTRPARFRIALTFQGKQGLIVLDQIRTLDRARLVKRLGPLRPATLAAMLQTLQAMFAP